MKKLILFIIIPFAIKTQSQFPLSNNETRMTSTRSKAFIVDNILNKGSKNLQNEILKLKQGILQTEIPENYNVKSFGAKGDGITDDTKAFKTLFILLIPDMGKGNFKIIIPQGNYVITEILETPNSASFFQ